MTPELAILISIIGLGLVGLGLSLIMLWVISWKEQKREEERDDG
jgi:hypothetical protein